MISIISPAKTLDLETKYSLFNNKPTRPLFFKNTAYLVDICSKLSIEDIESAMHTSHKIASLNHERFQNFLKAEARAAIFTYKGDVYQHLEALKFSKEDLEFAISNMRIISGLYGILQPLDLIRPYRLELGVKIPHGKDKINMCDFWQEKVTNYLIDEVKKHDNKIIINLASNEYSSVIDRKKLDRKNIKIIDITFKEYRSGAYKIVGINAKKMRGKMMRWIIQNKIEDPSKLQEFIAMGHEFSPEFSTEKELVFTK